MTAGAAWIPGGTTHGPGSCLPRGAASLPGLAGWRPCPAAAQGAGPWRTFLRLALSTSFLLACSLQIPLTSSSILSLVRRPSLPAPNRAGQHRACQRSQPWPAALLSQRFPAGEASRRAGERAGGSWSEAVWRPSRAKQLPVGRGLDPFFSCLQAPGGSLWLVQPMAVHQHAGGVHPEAG